MPESQAPAQVRMTDPGWCDEPPGDEVRMKRPVNILTNCVIDQANADGLTVQVEAWNGWEPVRGAEMVDGDDDDGRTARKEKRQATIPGDMACDGLANGRYGWRVNGATR